MAFSGNESGAYRMNGEHLTKRNEEIVRLCVEEGFTLREVGARFGLSHERVRQILIEAGRRATPAGRRRPGPPREQEMVSSQEVVRLYIEEALTPREIGARFSLNRRRVSRILERVRASRRRPGRPQRPSQHPSS